MRYLTNAIFKNYKNKHMRTYMRNYSRFLFFIFCVALAQAVPAQSLCGQVAESCASDISEEKEKTPSAELIAKRDALYAQLQAIVQALENSGVDCNLIGVEDYALLLKRGKNAMKSIFKECAGLEKKLAVLQNEWGRVLKEEEKFYNIIDKLEKIVDEVEDLQDDKETKDTKCVGVRKSLILGLISTGIFLFVGAMGFAFLGQR